MSTTTATFPSAPRFNTAPARRPVAVSAVKTGGSKTEDTLSQPWMTQAIRNNLSARATRLMRVGY